MALNIRRFKLREIIIIGILSVVGLTFFLAAYGNYLHKKDIQAREREIEQFEDHIRQLKLRRRDLRVKLKKLERAEVRDEVAIGEIETEISSLDWDIRNAEEWKKISEIGLYFKKNY